MKSRNSLFLPLCALFGYGCGAAGGSISDHVVAENLPEGSLRFGPTQESVSFASNHLQTPTQPFSLVAQLRLQQTGSWCVLGTSETVGEYYGLTLSQCRMADFRANLPEGTCCANRLHPKCDLGTVTAQQVAILSNMGLYGVVVPGAVSEELLTEEISNGRPVVLVEVAAPGSHSIAVTGFIPPREEGDPARFELIDPGIGESLVTYADLRTAFWASNAAWTQTIVRLAPSPDGCNRQFDPHCGRNDGIAPDGDPAVPFGNFESDAFKHDRNALDTTTNGIVYEPRPAAPPTAPGAAVADPAATPVPLPLWNADATAIVLLAAHSGIAGVAQCDVLNATRGGDGLDCCAADASYLTRYGFDLEPGVVPDMVSGASPPAVDPNAGTIPVVTCGQTPSSWKVNGTLEGLGLNGLHVSRPLTARELRQELSSGRQVLARGEGGATNGGGLVTFQDWAPGENGIDQFLVVRQGQGWQWVSLEDIEEARSPLFSLWTDSWYRITTE